MSLTDAARWAIKIEEGNGLFKKAHALSETMSDQTNSANLPGLSPQMQENIRAFLQDILTSLPEKVLSVTLTGSCVTGDYLPGKSDINSVLVLMEITPQILDALASLGRRYGKKGLSAPLIMTPEYIERSLDVFPVEFLDLKLIHSTIHGRDFFSDLFINKSLLRLQCERELKSKLIHLHQGYISSSGKPRALKLLLTDAYPGFFPLFRAMLAIVQMSRTPPLSKEEVLSRIEAAFGVYLGPLRKIRVPEEKGRFGSGRQALKELFTEVYQLTHELSLAMDQLSR